MKGRLRHKVELCNIQERLITIVSSRKLIKTEFVIDKGPMHMEVIHSYPSPRNGCRQELMTMMMTMVMTMMTMPMTMMIKWKSVRYKIVLEGDVMAN